MDIKVLALPFLAMAFCGSFTGVFMATMTKQTKGNDEVPQNETAVDESVDQVLTISEIFPEIITNVATNGKNILVRLRFSIGHSNGSNDDLDKYKDLISDTIIALIHSLEPEVLKSAGLMTLLRTLTLSRLVGIVPESNIKEIYFTEFSIINQG